MGNCVMEQTFYFRGGERLFKRFGFLTPRSLEEYSTGKMGVFQRETVSGVCSQVYIPNIETSDSTQTKLSLIILLEGGGAKKGNG